nr:glycosyltransferase [Ruminococcus sp.]
MTNALISVVVPVYNTDPHMLVKCFNSIIFQTYQSLELIIVDDGSNRETAFFLDSYKKKDSRIKVIHNKNGGASIARNTGIKIASGDYITFVDSDDWLEPDYIEYLLSRFSNDVDIVMCTRLFEYKNKTQENHFFEKNLLFSAKNKEALIKESIVSGVAGTWCKIYRRSFIEQNHLLYDPRLLRTQDIIFNLYAFNKAKLIKYVDVCKYHYRMQNDSVTKKFNPDADRILLVAAEEFVKYQKRFFGNNRIIQNCVYLKCLNILHEICKLKLMNSSLNVMNKNRFSRINNLCNKKVFREAIDKYSVSSYPT